MAEDMDQQSQTFLVNYRATVPKHCVFSGFMEWA